MPKSSVDKPRAGFHRRLTYAAIALALAYAGYGAHSYFLGARQPGDLAHAAGSRYFADGEYERALASYDEAVSEVPTHYPARVGRAETLILLGRAQEAISAYGRLIEEQPRDARLYANRGIAFDRSGRYRLALADYERALAVDADAVKGPGWLTRFLRNQAERPPGVADRARYLRQQLTLSKADRRLSIPAIDADQRPFKN
jgi:tetratricopeptide (TPR) repeat protein